jgi:SAM-dependent methyltransferase
VPLAPGRFDAVLSNSLLHHLPDPLALWSEVARLGRRGALVHVMDLFRPPSAADARAIVEAAAAGEDPILKEDFFNSLLAAWTVEEVEAQLAAARLGHLQCAVASERHLLVTGRL